MWESLKKALIHFKTLQVDAEKIINLVYKKMKEDGKENRFYEILKENNIKSN